MRKVIFVSRVVMEERVMTNPNELSYLDTTTALPTMDGHYLVNARESKMENVKAAPIHRLRGLTSPRSDTYIAYSERVQQVLELPFDVLKKEAELLSAVNRGLKAALDQAEDQLLHTESNLKRIRNASRWQRFLFFITGNSRRLQGYR